MEPRLMELFSLRRVSPPLFLPVDSPLLDCRYPGVKITLDGMEGDSEIVGSLDVWLRNQLALYDIAPGFGVFAIMNAIRPSLKVNPSSSPYVTAWAWQQAKDRQKANAKTLVAAAKKVYALLVETEKMILDMFPHLTATLQRNLDVIEVEELARKYPDYGDERRIYEHLHPRPSSDHKGGRHCAALFVHRGSGTPALDGQLWVWNRILNRPLLIVDMSMWEKDSIAGWSVGGNIYRDYLALQLLHQDRLLV